MCAAFKGIPGNMAKYLEYSGCLGLESLCLLAARGLRSNKALCVAAGRPASPREHFRFSSFKLNFYNSAYFIYIQWAQ